jgi:5-methylthioadenosine/S-adenosylhomocysteine deaminase
MTFVPADLRIEARFIAPMSARNQVLEDHSLLVRDGRILDVLPTAAARERYSAATLLQRASHLLIPGMINTRSDAGRLLFRAANEHTAADRFIGPEFTRDGILAAIADMLKSGITCFSDCSHFPAETALAAGEQGMRAVVGMPVAARATPWAETATQSVSRCLTLRDQYLGHPLISTVFVPQEGNGLSDETFSRLATLAAELDAGIMMDLHQSAGEIHQCIQSYGLRPIERLGNLGLLTPALNAVHMVHATAPDIELAQRTGISISLCPQSNLKSGDGLPPAAAFAAAGIRLGLGSGSAGSLSRELWGDMKLIALASHAVGAGAPPLTAWDVLGIATRGGASSLGLDDEVGTLEAGKWADLCCVDLSAPATQPIGDPLAQLVFNGARDMVSDVWVAGRQLVSDSEFTRLDWSSVAARSQAWSMRMNSGA